MYWTVEITVYRDIFFAFSKLSIPLNIIYYWRNSINMTLIVWHSIGFVITFLAELNMSFTYQQGKRQPLVFHKAPYNVYWSFYYISMAWQIFHIIVFLYCLQMTPTCSIPMKILNSSVIKSDLQATKEWRNCNIRYLNVLKTHYMIFTLRITRGNDVDIKIYGTRIQRVYVA